MVFFLMILGGILVLALGFWLGPSLTLMILGGILALAWGIWLGLAGEYRPRREEIEKALEEGGRPRYRVKRRFVAVDYLMRKRRVSQRRARGSGRQPFQLAKSQPPSPKAPPPAEEPAEERDPKA